MATRHEEIPLGSLIKANCSILCDGHYFSVDEKGVLNFTERYLLEVLVSDVYGDIVPGCKITVTKGEEQIEPFAEANNIFPLDEIDGEYTVNVSASGYVAQEVQVTASARIRKKTEIKFSVFFLLFYIIIFVKRQIHYY